MARKRFGLGAYLALTGVGRPDRWRMAQRRTQRQCLWLHAGERMQPGALVSFCQRLLQHRDDLDLVVTASDPEILSGYGLRVVVVPGDTPSAVVRFLESEAPVVGLWFGNSLCPGLISAAMASGCAMMALDIEDAPFVVPTFRWLADSAAMVLDDCWAIVAKQRSAQVRLRRIGLRQAEVHSFGALPNNPLPLAATPAVMSRATSLVAGRSVWLASHVQIEELDILLRAHRAASRYAHRLLLIVVPDCNSPLDLVQRTLEASGLRHRMCDAPPDPLVQVIVSTQQEDLGAWYRVAPICFLGGSLVAKGRGSDPTEAAALGSAVLYGPNVGLHRHNYQRFEAAGAARLVRNTDGLVAAITAALAPDTAATMSNAGWEIVTQGSDLVDWLLAQVCEALDQVEVA